jgi:hypothetical protein
MISRQLLIALIAIFGLIFYTNGIKLTVEKSVIASRPENIGIGMVIGMVIIPDKKLNLIYLKGS